jgi:hypothetical protein
MDILVSEVDLMDAQQRADDAKHKDKESRKVAQSMISTLNAQLAKKEENLLKYQTLLKNARAELAREKEVGLSRSTVIVIAFSHSLLVFFLFLRFRYSKKESKREIASLVEQLNRSTDRHIQEVQKMVKASKAPQTSTSKYVGKPCELLYLDNDC